MIAGLHKVVQRRLPVTLVRAGLPQFPGCRSVAPSAEQLQLAAAARPAHRHSPVGGTARAGEPEPAAVNRW